MNPLAHCFFALINLGPRSDEESVRLAYEKYQIEQVRLKTEKEPEEVSRTIRRKPLR